MTAARCDISSSMPRTRRREIHVAAQIEPMQGREGAATATETEVRPWAPAGAGHLQRPREFHWGVERHGQKVPAPTSRHGGAEGVGLGVHWPWVRKSTGRWSLCRAPDGGEESSCSCGKGHREEEGRG
jgi:hypothetical protein